jgi:hypothetical protein
MTFFRGGAEIIICTAITVYLSVGAHYFKLAADQGTAEAQFSYGRGLHNGECISIDLRSAAHYFKVAADQGLAEAECHYVSCLLAGVGLQRDLASAIRYFKISVVNLSLVGWRRMVLEVASIQRSLCDITNSLPIFRRLAPLALTGAGRPGTEFPSIS